MFCKITLFLMELDVTLVSAIVGYDCGRSASNITTVSLREVAPCTIDDDQPKIENIDLQLLQRIEYESVEVFVCRVKVERSIRLCGMFSHEASVKNGETTFFMDIRRDTCEDLSRYGSL